MTDKPQPDPDWDPARINWTGEDKSRQPDRTTDGGDAE